MAKIDLGTDMKDIPRDGSSDLIDAGDYLAEIQRATHQPARKDGQFDQVLLSLKILDAADPDQKQFIGKSFLEGVTLSPNARWRIAQLMDSAFGRVMEGSEFDTDDLIEKRLVVRTMKDPYDGKVRTRVDRFMPLVQWTGGAQKSEAAKVAAKAASDEEVDL